MRRGQINLILMILGSFLLAACPGGTSGGGAPLDGAGFGPGGGGVQQLDGVGASFMDKGPYRPPLMAESDPSKDCPNYRFTPAPIEEVPEHCLDFWEYVQANPPPQLVDASDRKGVQIQQVETPERKEIILPNTSAEAQTILWDPELKKVYLSPDLEHVRNGDWVLSHTKTITHINLNTDSGDSDIESNE